MSLSPVLTAPTRRSAIRNEADSPARLQHRETTVVQRLDLLLARFGLELLDREALATQVSLDRHPVLDQHHQAALEQGTKPGDTEVEVSNENGHQCDHSRDDQGARHRIVVLGDALLDQIAENHEHDQVEGFHGGELTPPDHPEQEKDNEKGDECANRDVHGYGKIVT